MLSPFEWWCRNFILPDICKPCLFVFLRNLFYLTLTPDEVRGLDNRYAILFIRGARPVMDLKYELTQHPAIRHTVDGGGPPYIHKGKQAPAFTGTPLFQAFSAEELNESEENAA